MSRYNAVAEDHTQTTNLAGGGAYTLSPEMDLYSTICTASLYPKFYETPQETLDRIRNLIASCDPVFVAKLAVYAREQMYLRTIPLVMAVELAKVHSGDSLVSKLVSRIIQRADELTEILAYYQWVNDRTGAKKLGKLSNQIRKGVATAFGKFDEYQFGKYNRDTEVKLRDALFLSHAKPVDDVQKAVFEKIINGNLDTPYTWETRLSEAGKNGETKKDVWEELIASKKVGYMAMLRNLRNILQAGVSNDHIEMVCEFIGREDAVKRSKQMPFRYLSAYRMLSTGVAPSRHSHMGWDTNRFGYEVDETITSNPQTAQVLAALEKAVIYSAANIPMFDGENVMLAADVSMSMCRPVSERSVIQRYDIGTVLSMLVHNKAQHSVTGLFGDRFETFAFPKSDVLRNSQECYNLEGRVGYSTHGYKVIQHCQRQDIDFDRIMIFTDCQLYGGHHDRQIEREWINYKKGHPNAKLYIFDLAGYGSTPVSLRDNDVTMISGWSDKVFDILAAVEGGSAALDVINNIEL